MVDDKTLIRAVKAGDHKAFESLIHRYQRQVANLIYVSMGGRDDVEDLMQEVFIRVYQSLQKYEFEGSFFSWIYKITMNLCIDEIRKRKIRKVLSFDFLTEDNIEVSRNSRDYNTPSDELLKEEKAKIIQSALSKLSSEHREVMVLREYQDLTYNEIAKTLGLTIEAVKSRIFRGRLELKKLLDKYFKERI